jgi:predicted nucleic acid-binding protein
VEDGFIAATVLEHDLTVVTRNIKDSQSLGVKIFDPWQ